MKTARKILIGALALAPSPLFACAACYGKSDSPLAHGMNWGIFTMLGIVTPVLGTFAFCFIRMIQKEEAANKNNNAPKNITDV
jgi:heme/copper-type cytochrome/quinol oxidase subunit 2